VRHIREPAARARLRGQLTAVRDLPAFIARRRAVVGDPQFADWLS
jgi:hypothetical protein